MLRPILVYEVLHSMIIERESTKTWSILVIKIVKNESWNLATKGFLCRKFHGQAEKNQRHLVEKIKQTLNLANNSFPEYFSTTFKVVNGFLKE